MRVRVVSVAVAAVLALASLSGCAVLGLGGTPIPASSSAAPAPSGSATPLPAGSTIPTPKPKTPPPALKNGGSAWMTIVSSLSAYGQWLMANPNPSLIGNVAAPGCALNDMLNRQVGALLLEKAYVQTSPVAITNALGPSPAIGGQVTVIVTASRAAEPVISRTNPKVVISTFAAVPPSGLRVGLSQGADLKWRLCTVEAYGGASDDPSIPLV